MSVVLVTGLSRLLGEREGELVKVREELDLAGQASSDLDSQLQDAHRKIEQLVSKSCDCHMI